MFVVEKTQIKLYSTEKTHHITCYTSVYNQWEIYVLLLS